MLSPSATVSDVLELCRELCGRSPAPARFRGIVRPVSFTLPEGRMHWDPASEVALAPQLPAVACLLSYLNKVKALVTSSPALKNSTGLPHIYVAACRSFRRLLPRLYMRRPWSLGAP